MSDKLVLPSMSKANMEAAGVEVKLSRAEIAEYVTEKVAKALKAELKKLDKEISDAGNYEEEVRFNEVPERYLALVTALRAAFPTSTIVIHRPRHHSNRTSKGETTLKYFVRPPNFKEHGIWDASLELDFRDDEVPAGYRTWAARYERVTALHEKLAAISKKKYRVSILEETLKGSAGGQKIVANVAELAAAVIGQTEAQ